MHEYKADKITVSYGKEEILNEISIEIPKGKIIGILGPNGCGKSTLLKTLGRMKSPKSGNITLQGEDIERYGFKDFAKKVAILPQTPHAPEGITIEEVVKFGRYAYQKRWSNEDQKGKEVVSWALQVTGLLDLSNKTLEEISGGQRQRVFIAMALAQQSEYIFLDEPTTFLDIAYQLEILELLKYLNEKEQRTIVMVLHDINLASKYCDYLIAMKDGKIIRKGLPKEVITQEILDTVFCVKSEIRMDEASDRPYCISFAINNRN